MRFRPVVVALLSGILSVFLFSSSSFAQSSSCPTTNPIVYENCAYAGTSPSVWDINGAGDPTIQGFATDISVNAGQTINFKIDTPADSYHIDIYRIGYYGGNGARLVTAIQGPPLPPGVTAPTPRPPQPACITDALTKLCDCGNWAVSASWQVPPDAVSGIYLAHLVRDDTQGDSHIVFIVRHDDSTSDILLQTSDTTWEAYNGYGGHSIYGPDLSFDINNRAYKVSYNRPFDTRGFGDESVTWFFGAEYPMVRWLERNGYNVSYFTGVDAARNGNLIKNHKIYLSVGHDEYWSGDQRNNVEAARDAGVNLAFFSGNESYWKTRWENSIDGSNTAYRTLVCYKETWAGAPLDPLDPPTWTGTWRDGRFSPPADGGRPENALTGTLFLVNGPGPDNDGTLSIKVPAEDGKMRFWRNTPNVSKAAAGTTWALAPQTLGYEWDGDVDNGVRPAGTFHLSTATYQLTTDLILDQGATFGAGTATHHMTLHRAPSGALVFGAGTVQWSWGLDSNHDDPFGNPQPESPDMQQATVNLFADMGVQPAALQTGSAAAKSADAVPPGSTITWPTNGTTLAAGSAITISGTAKDSGGGIVGGVELSPDGGNTWHPATGRENWTYAWTPTSLGKLTLKSRATDDSANTELPGSGVSIVTVTPDDCPCSSLSASGTPVSVDANDGSSVELGVRFRADFPGYVRGIRFYKSAANTGTHIGNLWTNTGTLLATAIFTNETPSGWQEVTFNHPIAINANTTYVASYFAPVGHYSATSGAFAGAGIDLPPLHQLPDGVDGANGVFNYSGNSTFPTQSFGSTNYWVDVDYVPSSSMPGAPPALLLNPFTLTFSALAGSTNPPPSQSVSVYNEGDGTLSWTASSNASWLIVSPASGSTPASPASLSVSVDASKLTAGSYTGTITVSALGATNPPQIILVSLTVTNLLLFSNFADGTMQGWAFSPRGLNTNWSVANGSLNYNGGGHTQVYAGDANWTDYTVSAAIKLSTPIDYPGGVRGRIDPATGAGYTAWLYPTEHVIKLFQNFAWNIDSGFTLLGQGSFVVDTTNFHNLQLSFQGSQIQVLYDGNVVISATDTTRTSGLIALDVSSQPISFTNVMVTSNIANTDAMNFDSSSLTFTAAPQSNPAPQNLGLSSSGGTLAWTATPDQKWLTVSQNYGTTPATLQVSVLSSALNVGSYTGNIKIVSLGVPNTTVTIPVTLQVRSATAASTTTISSSSSTSSFGQGITLTATVAAVPPGTGTPTGTVTFTDGSTTLASAAPLVGGTATYQTSNLVTGSHTITVTYSGDSNFAGSSGSFSQTVNAATPTVTWATPASITYGTALSGTQLNATSPVAGTFTYNPAAGTVLKAGSAQTLSVTFTPTDTTDYTAQTATVQINVLQAGPTVTWANPVSITYGTALSAMQLNATSTVAGSFTYSPAAGTVLKAGSAQTLSVTFTPTDTTDYTTQTATVQINVLQAAPTITWANPASITYGTALGGTQLNAAAGVPGTFAYTPAAGTILKAGSAQTLSVTFTPTDTTDYTTQTATVQINVLQAAPTITWANPASITYGTALTATQLNANASVNGTFTYSPAAGSVLSAGSGQTLTATFTPADATDYSTQTATVKITVAQAMPTILWPTPADIIQGTPLSSTQLNASAVSPVTGASVPGTYVYTPASGTVLPEGVNQLQVAFSPADTLDYVSAQGNVSINVDLANVSGSVTGVTGADTITTGDITSSTIPVQTSVTSPISGTVSIVETVTTQTAPTGYSFFSQQVNITAPSASATSPLVLVFTLDQSLITAGQNENTTQVFKNGVLVQDCTSANVAAPNPCVTKRELLSNGDVRLTVVTVDASHWNLGKSTNNTPPVANPDNYATNVGVQLHVAAPGLLANDTDADHNTLYAKGAPTSTTAGGTLALNSDGSFTYTPPASFSGTDTFTYYANDGTVNSTNPATVTISVAKTGTTTALSSSDPNTAVYGKDSVTFTATVTASSGSADPTGTVTFFDGGTTLGLSSLSASSSAGAATATYTTSASALAAGSHSITATYAGTTAFATSTSLALTQTVNTATQTITVTSTVPSSQAYNSTFNLSATGGASGNDVKFALDASSTACSIGAVTNASGTFAAPITMTTGTGNCVVDLNQDGNTNYGAAKQVQVSVAAATASQGTLTITGPTSLIYGSSAAITVSGGNGSGALTFSPGTSTGCSVTGATVKATSASGSCSLVATQAADSNYSQATSQPFSVTLNRATPVVKIFNGSIDVTGQTAAFTYNGAAQPVTASVTGVGSDALSITTITYDGSATAPVNVKLVNNAVAGYKVVATYNGSSNYNQASATASDVITKADPVVTVTAYNVRYDGSAHTAAGSAKGVETTPADLSSLLNLSGTTHTNVGTYNADPWTFAGNSNYNAANGTVNDSITQASSTVTVTFPPGPYVYNGSAFTATAQVNNGGVSTSVPVNYTGDCTNVTTTNGCTATATYVGDANHTGSTGTKSITIAQATSNVAVNCGTVASYVYTGLPQTPCTAVATGAGNLNVTLTPSYSNNVNVGTASVTATYSGDTNHSGSSGSGSFVISDVAPSAVADAYSGTENTQLVIDANSGLLANDSRTGGASLTVTSYTKPTNGSLTVNSDGSFTYTPNTGFYGQDSFTYTNTDGALTSTATVTLTINVVSVSQPSAAAGATVSTDTNNVGTSTTVPIQTSVTTPTGGPVSIAETAISQTAPTDYSFFGQQVNITAPSATSTTSPLVLVFTLDQSLITAGQNENTTQVFKNGVLVQDCTSPNVAVPSPCVTKRELLSNGDVRLTVVTVDASHWNLGKSTNNTPPVANPDSYATNVGVQLHVAAPGVLANDTDADHNTLSATGAPTSTTAGGIVALNSDGSFTYTPPAGFSGSDTFTYYANDGTVNSASPATVTITVSATGTTTTLTSSPDPSVYGKDSVTFTATVSASSGSTAPTGTVTFMDGTTTLGSSSLSASSTGGLATATYITSASALSAGTHSITASYAGPVAFAASTSPALTQTVSKATTTVTLASSANPSTAGQSLSLTATVISAAASGTVTFYDGSTALGTGTLSSGKTTFTTSSLSAGAHNLTASYGGDNNFAASTSSAVSQAVNAKSSTTTLAASPSPSAVGQTVTLTSNVSGPGGTPTGTVTFKDGTTVLGSGTLSNGQATLTTSFSTAGTHNVTANYTGDTMFASSASSTVSQTVTGNTASTVSTPTSSLNPSTYGQSVTFTASVTGTGGSPTGTLSFYDNGALLGSATLSGGTASIATTMVSAGTRSITAVYSGDGTFAGSTSAALTQTVNKATASATFSFSPISQQYSDQVTFKATLSPGPNNTSPATAATFKVGTQVMGTQNFVFSSSTNLYESVLTVPLLESVSGALSPGTKAVVAQFAANANYTVANRTGSLAVQAEDARTYYAGPATISTASSTVSTATIPLTYTIRDITAVPTDSATDPNPGNIALAKVTFVNRATGATIAAVPVTLVNQNDSTVGTATYNWTVDIGTATSQAYTVGTIVTGYYTRNNTAENANITVTKPQ